MNTTTQTLNIKERAARIALMVLLLLMSSATAWAASVNCLPSDIGKVLGMDGKVYTTVSAAGGMTKVSGMIAYVNTSTHEGIAIGPSDLFWNSCEGTGSASVTTAISACSGYDRTLPSAATTGWRLPSQADFNNMIGSDGCLSADNLRDMKGRQSSSCGVYAMANESYWSSTQTPGGYYYNLWEDDCTAYAPGTDEKHFRPCFTFSVTETFTISYNANGGSGTVASQTKWLGIDITLASSGFTRTGYTLDGWAIKSGGAKKYNLGETFTGNGNITMYAHWVGNTYYVRFNKNASDATGSMSNETFTYGTAKALTSNAFNRTGYTFAGWNTKANGSGTNYSNGQSVSNLTATNGATVDLYAQWTKITFPYRAFNTGTNTFETLTAYDFTEVTSSITTMGAANTETWYVVNSNVTVSSRITVNGTVHLILCDGATLTANGGIAVTAGDVLHIYSQSSGTGQLIADATGLNGSAGIGGGSSIGNITIHGGNITATGGEWSAGIGGGTNTGGGFITIYSGNVEGIGWRVNNNGNAVGIGRGSGGGAVAIQADGLRLQYYDKDWQDVTYSQRASALEKLRVRFFPCTEHSYSDGRCTHCGKYQWFTVTYNGNSNTGGSVPTDNTHYANDGTGTVTVRSNTGNLVRTGYTFGGWNTQADGLGTNYAPGTTFTIYGITTLYAKWTPITRSVIFNGNGATGGTMANMNITYDEAAQTLTANAFTRTGYTFCGWNTQADGNGTPYTVNATVSNLLDNLTLYAQWTLNTYTITYDLVGGTMATPNPTSYTAESAAITLTNPTRFGCEFRGWTGTGLTEPTMTVTIPHGSSGNRSYTATWEITTMSYLAYNATTETIELLLLTDPYTTVTSSTTAMTDGWYVLETDATVSSRIAVSGTVNLVLCDGATLTASQGINVATGTTLNIYGQSACIGTITATGGNEEAGIGGGYLENGGNITIHGGIINATGGADGAGIGGASGRAGGNITIHGGTVTARGGRSQWYCGAGIGGGDSGAGGNVTITGGTVIAYGFTSYGITKTYAIGHGFSDNASNGTLTLGDMKVYASDEATTPVAPANRESTCRSSYAKLMPCTEHNMENSVCTLCGFSYYHVTYDGNNATSGTAPVDATDYEKGQTVTILGNTGDLARTGYTFGGWNTQADGLGTDYAFGASFIIGTPLTLYAKWVVRQLTLANNIDNGDAINTATGDGMYYDVTIADRTLYCDGDWNTLVLPFDLDDFTGTPLEGATVKTLTSSDFNDGTLTMNFSNDLTSIEAGKPYIVKYAADLVIHSTADWNTFANNVNNGTESYADKTVMLAADISVSTMVGTGSNYSDIGNLFRGTFDGCGHTLNLNIQGGSSQGAAPFHYIGGATIKNVKTTGTVSGANHCSGLVGFAASHTTNTIQNCWIDADITCSTTHSSGILGWAYCATVRDCLFSGSITGSTTATGIIYGWGDDLNEGATHTIINCLAAGTYTNCSNVNMLICHHGTAAVTNCYKTQSIGSNGTYTTATGESLRTLLGDGWEVKDGNVVPKMVPGIVNPVFRGVTISDVTANVPTTYVDFVGTYSPVIYNNENKSVLFLSGGSTLYYPDGTSPTTIGACRAYFQLNGLTAGDPALSRIVLNFGDDGEASSLNDKGEMRNDKEAGAWFDLQGRRVKTSNFKLQTSKLNKGLYIHGGKKVVVK